MGLITITQLEDNTPASANSLNERFGAVVDEMNGNLDSSNLKNKAVTVEKLADGILSVAYPVGSIYMNASDATSPATLLGFGTWIAFGAGRVLVGIDATQTEFDTAEKTGGHKELQSHSHTGTTDASGNHSHGFTPGTQAGASAGSGQRLSTSGSGQQMLLSDMVASGNHQHGFTTGSAGNGNSGNLQPYLTVYMWRRTV